VSQLEKIIVTVQRTQTIKYSC